VIRTRALCALALMAGLAGCVQTGRTADDFDTKPWEAQKDLLPSYPDEENLIPFYVGPASIFAFSIDRSSVSIGQDGAVRYTLVARSPTATNVSYEAIRCYSYQRKVYAFGRPGRTWSPTRNPKWLDIERTQANPQLTLADDFYCAGSRVRTPEEAVQALTRRNQPTWLR